MGIRFIDRVARIARIDTALDGANANVQGTHVRPPARTGTIGPQLSGVSELLQGIFSAASGRIGTIGPSLAGVSSAMSGSFVAAGNHPPTFTDPGIQQLAVGVPYSRSVAGDWTDQDGNTVSVDTATAQLTPPGGYTQGMPPGITYNPATKTYSGTPTTQGQYAHTLEGNDGIADLQADFDARTAGAVWFHDFRNAAEVSAFRWQEVIGNDFDDSGDHTCQRNASDGIIPGSGCLDITVPANGQSSSGWWRPFAPLATNGRGVPDPGANGAITPKAWTGLNNRNAANSFTSFGYYAPTQYHSPVSAYDGTEFWIQIRCKITAGRFQSNDPDAGKLCYFSMMQKSLTTQELVIRSMESGRFEIYRSGSPPIEGGVQAGGQWPGGPFIFPADEWVTILHRIVPGTDETNNMVVQVWAARYGQTAYTKIWDVSAVHQTYEDAYPEGVSAFIWSSYMNGVNAGSTGWSHRLGQIIFSRASIPCPQVYA